MAKRAKKLKSKSEPPFETRELIKALSAFFDMPYTEDDTGVTRKIGSYKWGVYIFYDYDGEPIYVGQTKERVSSRIGRHLTNQRTDAVAMSVLDPFEVFEIEVYPLPQFEKIKKAHPDFEKAKNYLDVLENHVHAKAIKESTYQAILNEKDPPEAKVQIKVPKPLRGRVVSDKVFELRSHRDVRIARRAQIISRLAQTISEREVQNGLRRTLITQATRLRALTDTRFKELGGAKTVEKGAEGEEEEKGD